MDTEPGKNRKPIDLIEAKKRMTKLGWEIDGPFYTTVPTPKVNYVEKCIESVERLTQQLLKTVIIKDQFDKDHSTRREFERKNPEISTFSSKYSKLGGNILNGTLYAMEEIITRVKRTHPLVAEKLTAIVDFSVLAGYNQMSFEEKVIVARKLDDVIYKFLSVLSK